MQMHASIEEEKNTDEGLRWPSSIPIANPFHTYQFDSESSALSSLSLCLERYLTLSGESSFFSYS